jgi:hypothetical protein
MFDIILIVIIFIIAIIAYVYGNVSQKFDQKNKSILAKQNEIKIKNKNEKKTENEMEMDGIDKKIENESKYNLPDIDIKITVKN